MNISPGEMNPRPSESFSADPKIVGVMIDDGTNLIPVPHWIGMSTRFGLVVLAAVLPNQPTFEHKQFAAFTLER